MPQYAFGAGSLWGVRNDSNAPAVVTPRKFAILQDVQFDFSRTIKQLVGSYNLPVALGAGTIKTSAKAKAARIFAGVYADLYFGATPVTGQTLISEDEYQVIPSTGLTSSPTLAIGGTTTAVASAAFTYNIAGSSYNKGAVAAGTALAAGTVPQNTWGLYLFSINAAGTIAVTAAAGNGTGYSTEALAIAAMPATPANSVAMGYVTVMNTASGGFVAGTTALSAGTVTANYYNSALSASVIPTNQGTFTQDLGVWYSATGLYLQRVATVTAPGQYSVTAGGVYSFYQSDMGLGVNISYSYTVSTGQQITITGALLGVAPTFMAFFKGLYQGKQATLKLNVCMSTKLTFATKLEDWTIPEFDFEFAMDNTNTLGVLSLAE
jgi:hypothetical protein